MTKDYYRILNLQKGASKEQIKEAYRKLVLKYHPDVNKSEEAKAKMQEINEAYAVLGNEEKRQQYDAYGPEVFNRQFSQEDIFRGFNFEDIFKEMGINVNFGGFGSGEMFGGFFGGQQAQDNAGQSILYRIDLSLEDIIRGSKKRISVRHLKRCRRCSGSGGEPGSKAIKCRRCKGSGYMSRQHSSMFGSISTVSTCDECGGSGRLYERQCKDCSGKGGVITTESVEVNIPAGVREGMRLRLEGLGDFGPGRDGDLYIEIHELKHPRFERNDDNLITSVNIPFYTALLGGTVTVPTLVNGGKEIEIEKGTQHGKRIFLKGEGIKRFNGSGTGDEIAIINIEMPKSLSSEEKELIERFREINEADGRGKRKFGLF